MAKKSPANFAPTYSPPPTPPPTQETAESLNPDYKPIFSDPEIREMVVDFFNHCLSHSYAQTKLIRVILKSQNLTIEDIIKK